MVSGENQSLEMFIYSLAGKGKEICFSRKRMHFWFYGLYSML